MAVNGKNTRIIHGSESVNWLIDYSTPLKDVNQKTPNSCLILIHAYIWHGLLTMWYSEHFSLTPGSDCRVLLVVRNQNGARGRTVFDWSLSVTCNPRADSSSGESSRVNTLLCFFETLVTQVWTVWKKKTHCDWNFYTHNFKDSKTCLISVRTW